ncbi:lysophospholipid acyltransferase family protein [Psychroserpens damuponensis]|uniref:lysophospholipid acyltransferase family protein n=1 Tax=Psychroserpens damuponensis TaxID=943936 RepID=UPI0005903275|nr:lysophospholipid acyltransferase family protein [Psychroserpens damuponensis]
MQFIIYILVYPFLWLISKLPFWLLYGFSDLLYHLIYSVFGYRKKVVISNLKLVFPEKSEKEIKVITKKFYHHLCDMMVEAIKSLTISETEMKKRFKFTNLEILQDLENNGRSIALMCGHYGSWEWIFVLQSYIKNKGFAVYKRIENKYFDKLIKGIRAKYNSELITTKETIPKLLRAKVENKTFICGFVSDQSAKAWKALHWSEFMGYRVPMHTGAEMLAKRLDMAVVFFRVKRLKRGYYETTFETITEHPKEFDNYEITDQFFRLVEQQIKEAPEYYLWTHKRWKYKDDSPDNYNAIKAKTTT